MDRGGAQFRATGSRLGLRDLAEHGRADEDPIALDQGEVGRDDQLARRQNLADLGSPRFSKQPRGHRTGFGVEAHRFPRSAESSAAARPAASADPNRR